MLDLGLMPLRNCVSNVNYKGVPQKAAKHGRNKMNMEKK